MQVLIQQILHDLMTIGNYASHKVMASIYSKFLAKSVEDLKFEMKFKSLGESQSN